MNGPVLAVVGAIAVAATLALLAAVAGHNHERVASSPPLIPGPSVVIGHGRVPAQPVSAADLLRARRAARTFLRSYVPFLYGRASARRVPGVTTRVRASLARVRARETPTQRRRRPRTAALTLSGQDRVTVLVRARIVDGSAAPYALTFTLTRRGGRWLVSDLGSD